MYILKVQTKTLQIYSFTITKLETEKDLQNNYNTKEISFVYKVQLLHNDFYAL